MPTLQRRIDGCFFIRHFYGDHSTSQIQGDGVRYLEPRNIIEGGWFSTDLFMELWTLGLVYRGDTPPHCSVSILQETVAQAAVRTRVSEFHRLIYLANAQLAWTFVWPDEQAALTFEQFRNAVSNDERCRLVSWYIKDILVYELSPEFQATVVRAKRLAVVTVEIGLVDSIRGKHEVTQFWLESNDQWWVRWKGLNS